MDLESRLSQIEKEVAENNRLLRKLIRRQNIGNVMSGIWWGLIILSVIVSIFKLGALLQNLGDAYGISGIGDLQNVGNNISNLEGLGISAENFGDLFR